MTISRLAVLTHGADAPGMNAAIRATVRMAVREGWQALGVRRGLEGLLAGEFAPLGTRSVSGTIERGGTLLGTSNAELDAAQVRTALRRLNEAQADALIVIGGRDAMRGAVALAAQGCCVLGLPASIENDICGTDQAIGVDTALNTALDALDRIRDTASSQQEAFVVEVAGRCCGHLALLTALAGGAEVLCVPEHPCDEQAVATEVSSSYVRGKEHCIILVAEGARPSAQALAAALDARHEEIGFATRLIMLSHLQRGGSPLAQDRYLATALGAAAVSRLAQGEQGVLVGLVDGATITTPLDDVATRVRALDESLLAMARVLAR
ncbi:MAG: ATP-dependent 6-phosphofructokinase [Anaerolineae bacterium]|jgi:6-phosphofructokinase 1